MFSSFFSTRSGLFNNNGRWTYYEDGEQVGPVVTRVSKNLFSVDYGHDDLLLSYYDVDLTSNESEEWVSQFEGAPDYLVKVKDEHKSKYARTKFDCPKVSDELVQNLEKVSGEALDLPSFQLLNGEHTYNGTTMYRCEWFERDWLIRAENGALTASKHALCITFQEGYTSMSSPEGEYEFVGVELSFARSGRWAASFLPSIAPLPSRHGRSGTIEHDAGKLFEEVKSAVGRAPRIVHDSLYQQKCHYDNLGGLLAIQTDNRMYIFRDGRTMWHHC